jgi:hypothetical protein
VREILYEAKTVWLARFWYHGYWGGLEIPNEQFQLGAGKGPDVQYLPFVSSLVTTLWKTCTCIGVGKLLGGLYICREDGRYAGVEAMS